MEAAFQEVRTHLGVETRRQWSATAIARTTPALLSRLIPVAHRLRRERALRPRRAAWYAKTVSTFSDVLAGVRRALADLDLDTDHLAALPTQEPAEMDPDWRIPEALWERIAPLLPVPPPRPKGGRPRKPDRPLMDAVFRRLWQEGLPACDAERGLEWDIESSVPAARGHGPDPVKPTGRFSRALSRRAARLPNPGPDAPLRNQRLL